MKHTWGSRIAALAFAGALVLGLGACGSDPVDDDGAGVAADSGNVGDTDDAGDVGNTDNDGDTDNVGGLDDEIVDGIASPSDSEVLESVQNATAGDADATKARIISVIEIAVDKDGIDAEWDGDTLRVDMGMAKGGTGDTDSMVACLGTGFLLPDGKNVVLVYADGEYPCK